MLIEKTKIGYTTLLALIKSTSRLDGESEVYTVKKLIAAGADVNEQSGPEGFTPLHLAIIHCKPRIVKTILDSGKANVLLVDRDGCSALHMVAAYRDYTDQIKQIHEMQREKKIAEYIIQYSEAINIQDKFGNTPLHTAAINGNVYVVALFLEKDYLFPQQKLLSIKNKAGRTVLHEVAASGKQGKKILNLLIRIASQQDFNEENAWKETIFEMVDRLIEERSLLKNKSPSLLKRLQTLLVTSDHVLNRSQRENISIRLFPNFQKLIEEFMDLMIQVKELPQIMNVLLRDIVDSYAKLRVDDQISQRFVSEINFFSRRIKDELDPFQGLNSAYIEELVEIKKILLQKDYYVWKENILRLPSSFSDYRASLPDFSLYHEPIDNNNYQIAKNFYDAGIYGFNIQNYPYAIKQLSESVNCYSRYFPGHIGLADAHYALGRCYQQQSNDQTARVYLEQSKAIYLDLQVYPQLEKVYQVLVEIEIDHLNLNYQTTQLDILRDSQRSDKEKFCAHVALASFYKQIRTNRQVNLRDYEEALNRALIAYESYHYSLAYELTQGVGDQDARLVLQREIGVSLDKRKLGTYNIQQCVALFAYDRKHHKLVLLHIDRFSGPLTLLNQLFRQFSSDAHLDIYLSGGRDQSDSEKLISDNNINQVLKGLYYYRHRINILAADLGDKPSPPAVIFDPDANKLIHSTAQYPDRSLNFRAAQMHLNLIKVNNDYLYPLNVVNYDAMSDDRIKRDFSPVEIEQLTSLYSRYYSQALQSSSYKSWYHNQILYPLLNILDAKDIETYTFNHPISLNLKKGTFQNNWNQIGSLSLFLPPEKSFESVLDLLHFSDQPYGVNDFFNPLKRPLLSKSSPDNTYKKLRLAGSSHSFEEATENSQFDYWLEQSDIADIARIVFNSYRTTTGKGEFEILSDQGMYLETQLQKFRNAMLNDESGSGRLTLIISLDNNHWVTVVIQYQLNTWRAFYVNSASGFTLSIPESIVGPLQSLGTVIYNLSHARQRDVSNCGLWALEAAELINTLIDGNLNWRGQSWEEELDKKGLSTLFFKKQRKRYAALLRNDFQRLIRKADWLDELLPIQACAKRKRRGIGHCFSGSSVSSERLDLLRQAQSWSDALSASGHLQPWIPMLATAREIANGREEIYFYNLHTQEEKAIFLPQKTTIPFREGLHRVYKNLYGVLKFISRRPEQSLQIMFDFKKGTPQEVGSRIEDAEAIDGLNAAFTTQALLAFFQQKNCEKFQTERGSLSLAFKIHTYINIIQMLHGTTLDAVRIRDLIKTLLRQESLVKSPLSAFTLGLKQVAMEGVGTLLGIISVGLDITELTKATTEAEKALFGTQLVFDSGSVALPASSMGAAFFGASGAAAGLSSGGVILAGLGIGITGLIRSFNQVVAEAEAVGSYFYQINEAYKNLGYKIVSENNQTYMTPYFGAVISEINFQNATIIYGSQFIYRTRPRSRGVYGSGKANYISWAGDMPTVVRNKTQALNIRERLGYRQQVELGNWKACLIWILPYMPVSYIDYTWTHLPFATSRNDNGFSVLRKLEEQKDFDYDFYIFPSEYIISKIFEKRIITPIIIRLDNQLRTFFIPKFSKRDRELYTHIRYIFRASLLSGGECYLYLDKVDSIQLEEQHANYTWILSAEGLSDDTLLFTNTGITIGNIPIEIPQRQAQYRFIDKMGETIYFLDFTNSRMTPISIDYKFVKQHHPSLQEYVKSHTLLNVTNTSNSIVILTRFDLQSEYKRDYQGKAYYSISENRLFYTNHMPQKINDGAHLVYFTKDSAYFFNSELNFFWRADSQHRLAEHYVFLSEFTNKDSTSTLSGKNIVSVGNENGVITVIQTFSNHLNTTQRHAIYHISDNKLQLIGLQDDTLLRNLHAYSILINSNKQIYQEQYDKALQNLCSNSIFYAKVGKNPMLKFSGRVSYAEFNQVIRITPFTQQSNLTALWVRRNKANNYQLIRPRLFKKPAIYLGSLFTPDQREVFFFFTPRNKEVFGKLYRQIEGEYHAIQLDLTLISAFFTSNTLLAFTSNGIVKKIDALGKTYTVSFTHEWTNAHSHWWSLVPLCLAKSPPAERHIPLFGMTDQSGKALAVWYDTKNQQFVLAYPPLKANGQQFHMTYLGRVGNKNFFHSENKTVYYQMIEQGLMGMLFQGTQLKKSISPLSAVAIAKKVYLHNQKVWIHTETGFLFSFAPQNPDIWFLEKIYFKWFHENNCINNDPLRASIASVVRNEAEYIKYCLSFIFPVKNKGFNIPDIISMQDAHFNFSDASLIPIEKNWNTTMLWWRPKYDQFFSVSQQKDASEWIFLATTANQDHYFFSAKEKIIYILSADTVINSQKSNQIFLTDLALRFNKSILWQLRASYMDFLLIPLFEDVEVLEFDIILSEQKSFVLYVSNEGMNHYQIIAYQASFLAEKELSVLVGELAILRFDVAEISEVYKFFALQSKQDIVISHTQYPCQFILTNAMTLEVSRNISIQFMIRGGMSQFKVDLSDIKNRLEVSGMESIFIWTENTAKKAIQSAYNPVFALEYGLDQGRKNLSTHKVIRPRRALTDVSFVSIENEKILEKTHAFYDKYDKMQAKQVSKRDKNKINKAVAPIQQNDSSYDSSQQMTAKSLNRISQNRKYVKINSAMKKKQSLPATMPMFKQEKVKQATDVRYNRISSKQGSSHRRNHRQIQASKVTSRLNLFKSIDSQQKKYLEWERQENPRLMDNHQSYQQYPTKSGISRTTASLAFQETLYFLRLFLPKYKKRPPLDKKIVQCIDKNSRQKIAGKALERVVHR